MEEDEGEEEDSAKEPSSDSDSDFAAAAAEGDDDSESDAEDSADAPASSAAPSVVLPAPSAQAAVTMVPGAPAALDVHPSWSDLPAVGESGADDLPALDFASLTLSTLAAVPATSSNSQTAPLPSSKPAAASAPMAKVASLDGASKKAFLLARRDAKSAAAKEKDPIAWEAAEVARKERELEKKKEKRERVKQRKRESRLEGAAPAPDSTVAGDAAEVDKLPPPPRVPTGPRLGPTPRAVRAPVPSRPSRTAVSMGLAPPPHLSSSTTPSPTPSSPAPNSSTPSSSQTPYPRRSPHVHDQVVQQREAYSSRMAADPSLAPQVGKFWSHDARLAAPEVRALNPYWRGRGRGGELRGGYMGRGSERGGRGGMRGRGGWSGGWGQGAGEPEEEKKDVLDKGKGKEDEDADGEEDDGWGRGEAKRKLRSAITPSSFPPTVVSDWSHDGFAELKEDEARPAPPLHLNIRGRGGFPRGGRGRGGWHAENGGPPAPGSINPRYAGQPFHPFYRYPGTPTDAHTPSPLAAPVVVSTRPVAGDSQLFEGKETSVVRLPGVAAVAPTEDENALEASASEEAVVVNLGPSAARPAPEVAPAEERKPRSTSILYAADPDRLPSPAAEPPLPSYPLPQQPLQQQQQQPGAYYQLPPHLQGQQPNFSTLPPQPLQYPRHASPAFYPHPQYYSPDAFPNMPTPGATPPPLFPGQSAAPFFVPPRHHKIEIKAPGSPGLSKPSFPLSASGDTFAPRQPIPYSSVRAPSFQPHGSPVSSRDGMSPSPMGMSYGYGYGAPQEYVDGGGGMVYFQQQAAQGYYESYGAYPQQQQQVDPAILSMSASPSSQYYPQHQQQQQRYAQPMMANGGSQWLPPPAQYGQRDY